MTIDLTGQKFGELTVLERTKERQDGYCVWRCRCSCGKEILVNTKRLQRGTMRGLRMCFCADGQERPDCGGSYWTAVWAADSFASCGKQKWPGLLGLPL